MRRLSLLLMLLPAFASAQAIRSHMVSTRGISPASPAHYVKLEMPLQTLAASGTVWRFHYPHSGSARLVDVVITQVTAGAGGASWSLDLQNGAATSLLATAPVATQASGNKQVTDAKGELALPSGWTRPVLKTDSTVVVSKGAYLSILPTESGTYSTHAAAMVTLIFEPLQ